VKGKAKRKCACGCKLLTGGTWYPGHDARMLQKILRKAGGILPLARLVGVLTRRGEPVG